MEQPSIFVSYSHKDEREKDLVLAHLGVLQHTGFLEVWSDDSIMAGDDWKQEIKRAIDKATVAILVITANFLTSEFILNREVPELLKRRQSAGMTIFPIIARACAWERVGWLSKMNVRPKNGKPIWSDAGSHVDEDLTTIVEEVANIVEGPVKRVNLRHKFRSRTSSQRKNTGTSSAPLVMEPPYGTMPLDSRFYIKRQADDFCLGKFNETRAVTLFVQASRQMGKSSLMRRTLDQAKRQFDKKSAFIDFQRFPEQYLSDEEKFLKEFCVMISEALDISVFIDQYWQHTRTEISNCSRYLSEYVIPEVHEPFVLAMDEIGRMANSPFRANFFGMLRTWNNDRLDKNFAKMSLFFSSAIAPYMLVDDPYQSPFNVAEDILLQDFTPEEVEELNQRHRSPLTKKEIAELMALVGGHPFLIRLALYQLATEKFDFPNLINQAAAEDGPFGLHLRSKLWQILNDSELKEALICVLQDSPVQKNSSIQRLIDLGLVKRDWGRIVLRNNLYIRFFESWLN